MRVLHYSLGFPPYRSGGLTKFCMDLMRQQLADGHEVGLLWPGNMTLPGRKPRVRRRASVEGIASFEVLHPLPVPYDEGILDLDAFMDPGSLDTYGAFLDAYAPDVIHIHTLMGLHEALLDAAKQRGVRLVFTAHDFFPICPKVTLYRHGGPCKHAETCEECAACNATALSLGKIRALQSPLYRAAKDSAPVRWLRKRHRDAYLGGAIEPSKDSVLIGDTPLRVHREQDIPLRKAQSAMYPKGSTPKGHGTPEATTYLRLRTHYGAMLSRMDAIHYNSTVTRAVYQRFFDLPNATVLPISHASIADHKQRRTYGEGPLRIRYLGPQSEAKGYYLLVEALDLLWEKRKDFRLDVHFTPAEQPPYLYAHPRYDYAELSGILENTDVVVVPSVWQETFGFTALEALSYGVPVVLSGTVGARDILAPGAGVVVEHPDERALADAIDGLTPERLADMNKAILERQKIPTMKDVVRNIMEQTYEDGCI